MGGMRTRILGVGGKLIGNGWGAHYKVVDCP